MKPNKQHAKEILLLLKSHYPDAKMVLKWGNNWELLVAIILSAQCTDKKVNEVTEKLFPKYEKLRIKNKKYLEKLKAITPQIQEVINFASVPVAELEKDIRSTGFYHNKARNIQAAAKVVLENYHGYIPKTISELIGIPGVGRKTANVFLGNAYGIVEGIAVDTHVSKQSHVLGLTNQTNPDKIERDLMDLFDKKDWFKLTYLLIEHGRNMRRRKDLKITCGKADCLLCNKD